MALFLGIRRVKNSSASDRVLSQNGGLASAFLFFVSNSSNACPVRAKEAEGVPLLNDDAATKGRIVLF